MNQVRFLIILKENTCICDRSSIERYSLNNLIPDFESLFRNRECQKCPNNLLSSNDKKVCMGCSSGVLNSDTGDCRCNQEEIIVEKDNNGLYLTDKVCSKCSTNEFQFFGPSVPVYECKKCEINKVYNKNRIPWLCECNTDLFLEFGGECINRNEATFLNTQFPSAGASSVLMSDAETSQPKVLTSDTISESATMRELYFKNAFKCLKDKNKKACQTLANLCVLQMYDLRNEICKTYQFINNLRAPIENKK